MNGMVPGNEFHIHTHCPSLGVWLLLGCPHTLPIIVSSERVREEEEKRVCRAVKKREARGESEASEEGKKPVQRR